MPQGSIEVTFTIENEKRIKRALNELPGNIAGRVLQRAAKAGAGVIRDEARRIMAGYGWSRQTQLALVTKSRRRGQYTVTEAVTNRGGIGHLWLLELGTESVGEVVPKHDEALRFFIDGEEKFAKSIQHKGIAAKPFLRPAFDTKQDDALRAFGQKLWEAIESEARKLKAQDFKFG